MATKSGGHAELEEGLYEWVSITFDRR